MYNEVEVRYSKVENLIKEMRGDERIVWVNQRWLKDDMNREIMSGAILSNILITLGNTYYGMIYPDMHFSIILKRGQNDPIIERYYDKFIHAISFDLGIEREVIEKWLEERKIEIIYSITDKKGLIKALAEKLDNSVGNVISAIAINDRNNIETLNLIGDERIDIKENEKLKRDLADIVADVFNEYANDFMNKSFQMAKILEGWLHGMHVLGKNIKNLGVIPPSHYDDTLYGKYDTFIVREYGGDWRPTYLIMHPMAYIKYEKGNDIKRCRLLFPIVSINPDPFKSFEDENGESRFVVVYPRGRLDGVPSDLLTSPYKRGYILFYSHMICYERGVESRYRPEKRRYYKRIKQLVKPDERFMRYVREGRGLRCYIALDRKSYNTQLFKVITNYIKEIEKEIEKRKEEITLRDRAMRYAKMRIESSIPEKYKNRYTASFYHFYKYEDRVVIGGRITIYDDNDDVGLRKQLAMLFFDFTYKINKKNGVMKIQSLSLKIEMDVSCNKGLPLKDLNTIIKKMNRKIKCSNER